MACLDDYVIAIGKDICVPQRIIPIDFGDPLTFPVAPTEEKYWVNVCVYVLIYTIYICE